MCTWLVHTPSHPQARGGQAQAIVRAGALSGTCINPRCPFSVLTGSRYFLDIYLSVSLLLKTIQGEACPCYAVTVPIRTGSGPEARILSTDYNYPYISRYSKSLLRRDSFLLCAIIIRLYRLPGSVNYGIRLDRAAPYLLKSRLNCLSTRGNS